jgi:hypothetical protein
VADQGIDVLALHFISPFFGASKRGRETEVEAFYRESYGLNVRVVDVSDEFMKMLGEPRYGYGKNFNPCIDCKIFLFQKAQEAMLIEGAEFLITGEVVGQRPMSQRRDTMNLIAKQLGAKDILLRPLSAKIMEPTRPEREGWVDREKLLAFNGRNRTPQIALAAAMGIRDYPAPAGGCSLTDVILSKRVRRYFDEIPAEERDPEELRMLLFGRPFVFPGGSMLTIGRSDAENMELLRLFRQGDEVVRLRDFPGPVGMFRARSGVDERALAASVLLRYCPKAQASLAEGKPVRIGFGPSLDQADVTVEAQLADPQLLETWRR